jgi:diguanylate cyclase (GGDEF)-like protein
MDYGTFFLTNIASGTVFTVCIGILAWNNRRVAGMHWFAAAQILGLAKLILQGLEGKISPFFSSLTANELYLISFLMQWMGLRWFVVRAPLRSRWPLISIGIAMASYIAAFGSGIPYIANLINLPFVAVCGVTAWMLWKHAGGPFATVARTTAGIAALQMAVAAYRAMLTNLRYIVPRETVNAHTDASWVYSLAAAAFLATVMVMCELWFLVTELQRELAEQARTDPLTGALNRRSMEEAALRETARSVRVGHALSMIVIDIDNFKQLNDTRGHAAGDRALQALVRRVKSALRQQDLLARTGGEEFAVLLPETDQMAALGIAERVRRAVEKLEVIFEEVAIRMTICAGVAQLDPARGWEDMLRQADAAMYEAKNRGRNLVSAQVPASEANEQFGRCSLKKGCHYVQAACRAT